MNNLVKYGCFILVLICCTRIARAQAPARVYIKIVLNEVRPGESFEFLCNNEEVLRVTQANTPVSSGMRYVAGSNFVIRQSGGPRSCRIINGSGILGSKDTVIQIDSRESQSYRVGVSYATSLYSNQEKFEFTLNGGPKIELNANNPVVYFPQRLASGERYSIAQVSGPRPCNFSSYNEGTVQDQDVLVPANCGHPPLTILKINITGVAQGEQFSFSDNYRRSLTVPFSVSKSIGGFPRGDRYVITQTGGPRPCKLTNNEGIVPDSSITIQCDCSKPLQPPPVPVNKIDLITRSSDNKNFYTYYETWVPVVAGENENEGRYVAFTMYGKGADGSSGNYRQIYWRDRKEGITKLVSKTDAGEEADGNCFVPSISADGQSIVFESYAKNLSGGDANGLRDVFLWQRSTGKVTLISRSGAGVTGNGESYEPAISGDGNTIAYTSNASNIVTLEPVYTTPNIYVHDIRSGSTIFITKDFETGKAAGGYSPTISDDGTKVAFCAWTGRLVNADKNNLWDIFLWQRGQSGLKRISVPSVGAERDQGTESSSRVVYPNISGDGSSIVFATTSTTLTGGDTNGMQDVFLYNTNTGKIKKISSLNNTIEGDGDSPIGQGERIGISYNGKWVTYNTNASNFGTPKGNIVVQNTETGKIIPVTSITIGSTARPMLSRQGYYVVAGCSEQYDKRYPSSGLFAFYVNLTN